MSRSRILFVALLLCGCTDDVLDASYADVGEVEADGAIERGWIPGWIPRAAFNIHEVHDIDTSESALVFELPRGSTWEPPTPQCEVSANAPGYETKFDRAWLPESIDGFRHYRCGETQHTGSSLRVVGLAIRPDGQQVVHWRQFAP